MTVPFNLASFAGNVSSTGTANPSAISDIANTSTGALGFPVGTTAQRNGTPVTGMTRINSTTNVLESYYNGSWVTISTFTPPGPTVIGEAYGGGYYAGKISTTGNGVATHYLIIAPKATGQTTLYWTDPNSNNPNTTSVIDGPGNTNAMNSSTYPAAQWIKNLTIGGYNDWYMPALNEVITLYYFLKPDTTANYAGFGSNANAVSPQPLNTNYNTASPAQSPAQTTATAFRTGGSEEITTLYSSTIYSATQVYNLNFSNGIYAAQYKNNGTPCRAVRRIPI